jgi:hypothetical protein
VSAATPTIETAPPELGGAPPPRRRRRRIVAGAGVAVVIVVAAGLVVADPFGGGGPRTDGTDNETATSLASVARRSLSSQTQVSATLGYADPSTIAEPAGTAASALAQARQTITTSRSTLSGAQATLATDARTLDQTRATLAADRQKQAVDCQGDNAAESPASGSSNAGGSSGAGPCATDAQAVATDGQSVSQAAAKVATDRQSVAAARTAVAAAQASLAEAAATETVYSDGSTYTMLPDVGRVVRRNEALYAIGGQPVVLLYGSTPAWRAFIPGMSPGSDVAELNTNLRTLGYGPGLAGDAFTGATAAAIRAYQAAHAMPQTGRLLLGSVVFEPGAIRVTAVTPTPGATVQAGAVLTITSTRRQVTIDLDAAQQGDVKVGDPVTITLPSNETTPGRVTSVGTVATVPDSSDGGGGGDQTPTVEVDVTPTDPAATGRLDQAPVQVSITTDTARNALVVPVDALLALASGGYAVEEVKAGGVHQLVPVELGLFDDADGLVQVTGPGLAPGQRVVVPAE